MPEADPRNKVSVKADRGADAEGEGEGEDENRRHGVRKAAEPEFGGADGPEPTRYGDWERNGRCTDF
jgi:hypothetical protein